MLMQNRMESISKITCFVIFHNNSTCYNYSTPRHHAAECPVLIICKNCSSLEYKAIECMKEEKEKKEEKEEREERAHIKEE